MNTMFLLHLLALAVLHAIANCEQFTTLVTATTTITATETGDGACQNFNGACVVYGGGGEGGQATPYTTTVFAGSTPSSTRVTTTTVYISAGGATTAAASSACQNFNGACVVYATDSQGHVTRSAATTIRGGNGNGEIGRGKGNSEGYIAAGAGLSVNCVVPVLAIGFISMLLGALL